MTTITSPEFDTLLPFSLFHFFKSPAALHSTVCHVDYSLVMPAGNIFVDF